MLGDRGFRPPAHDDFQSEVGEPFGDEALRRADQDTVITYLERWSMLPRARAVKALEFMTDPTWRAYLTCYIEGYPLCRNFVDGDPARFRRLITEQLVPQDLAVA